MAYIDEDDLIDDRALGLVARHRDLTSDDDSLGHMTIAGHICDIASLPRGQENVAVFAPWGAGKSSLFDLIKQVLKDRVPSGKRPAYKVIVPIRFDASTTAGKDFSVNFLSEVGKQLSPSAAAYVRRSLFQTRRSVDVPFGPKGWSRVARLALFLGIAIALFVLPPVVYTSIATSVPDVWAWLVELWRNVQGWASVAVSGTLIVLAVSFLSDLLRVSIEESTPGAFTQFREIFDHIVESKTNKYLIFIDELDRCSPEALVATLEGLRSFLGHSNCVVVAAFDRSAVARTISDNLRSEVTAATAPQVPYYKTAGEYLDKIFQYQLSLPPQDARTFRRFAEDLVAKKQGVWGEIRDASPDRLHEVIALLSPAHLVSARRTKVLLNDFALACRELEEILGESWIERVDEIAIHSVIQTEFPQLADDMVSEPDILRYIIDPDLVASREALAAVVERYRTKSVELDLASVGTENTSVRTTMHDDLVAYLARSAAIGARLPRPDVTRRATSPLLSAFEDAGLYEVVTRAVDAPAAQTVAALVNASDHDWEAALSSIDEQFEKATLRFESRNLAMVLGQLRAARPDRPVDPRSLLLAWKTISSSGELDWIDELSLTGLVEGPMLLGASNAAAAVLRQIEDSGRLTVTLLAHALLRVPEQNWVTFRDEARDLLIRSLLSGHEALLEATRRDDSLDVSAIDQAWVMEFSVLTLIPDPEPLEPSRQTSAAIAEAEQFTEAAMEATVARREALRSSLRALFREGGSLSLTGAARRGLLRLAFHVPLEEGDREAAIETLVGQKQSDEVRGSNIVWAWANASSASLSMWSLRVAPGTIDPGLASAAANRVVDLFGDDPAVAVARLEELGPHGISLSERSVGLIIGRVEQLRVASAPEAASLLRVLRQGGADLDVDSVAQTTILRLLGEVESQVYAVPVLHLVASETASVHAGLRLAMRDFSKSSPLVALMVLIRLAHLEMGNGGKPTLPPLSVVRNAIDEATSAEIVNSWLGLGPRFQHVQEAVPRELLLDVPAATWAEYSKHASKASRDLAWRYLRQQRRPSSRLLAIAMEGVSPAFYDEAAAAILRGNSSAREQAAGFFMRSLPQGTPPAARATVVTIEALAGERRVGDLELVSKLVAANADALGSEQRSRVLRLLDSWPPTLRPAARRARDRARQRLRA